MTFCTYSTLYLCFVFFLSLLGGVVAVDIPMMRNASGSASANGTKGSLPLDVDGYPVAPPQLELQQVHIYTRHGERAPVGVRMTAPPASLPEHWMFCHTAQRFRAAITGGSRWFSDATQGALDDGEDVVRTQRIAERRDGSAVEGECLLGELSDVGKQSTYNFGHALRRLYIDRLDFLPDVVHSNSELYLRSTYLTRTIDSLEQILRGLYPTSKSAEGFTAQIRIRNGKDDNLFGNVGACKRLDILQIEFARAAAKVWNRALRPLDKKVSKYIGGNPIRLDGRPRASGILDTIRAAEAHGVKIPSEFQEEGVIDLIEAAVVDEWFGDKTEEIRRLGMGPLLGDLSLKMHVKAGSGDRDPLKILIHSTHDTALAALCTTLGVFDGRWPAFTSSVTFELFRRRDQVPSSWPWQKVLGQAFYRKPPASPTDHYVRVRYQNRNLHLPFCADEGRHLPGAPEFCTLAAFRERVKELTPRDWDAECAVGADILGHDGT